MVDVGPNLDVHSLSRLHKDDWPVLRVSGHEPDDDGYVVHTSYNNAAHPSD